MEPELVVAQFREALTALRDADRAAASQAYMKDVAPFLGIPAPALHAVERRIIRGLPPLTEGDLIAVADALWALPEREYRYAACALLGRLGATLGPGTLDRDVRRYLTTDPWWDTVDLLGSRAVTPLVARFPDLVDVMWRWNATADEWLIRASIQHQRGLGQRTDVPLLLALCEPHADDRRFFVAKAIGWALRDLCRIDAVAVERFLADHPALPAVARREARTGLARAAARS